MKKLLSLLSVLTISGTAVPTTIAASLYQKQETIKNSNINYQQTNNLETLSRDKRQNNSETIINFNKTTVNYNYDGGLLNLSVNLLGNFSFTFYEFANINVTSFTNIKNWNEFTKKYNFIRFNGPTNITFSRKDGVGGIAGFVLTPKDINISSLSELRHGYNSSELPLLQFGNGRGYSTYEAQRTDELPFNNYSEKLFSETLPNKLAFSKISVYISAVKLIPSNNGDDLILRLVYKVIYTHFATADGINLNGDFNNGSITLFKK